MNNLPGYLRNDNQMDNVIFRKYVNLTAEYFDLIKNYIDNYTSFHNRGYDKYSTAPPLLLDIIGKNFGWNFINSNSIKSLLEYYVGKETSAFNY